MKHFEKQKTRVEMEKRLSWRMCFSHEVTLGDSHGREPVVCNKSDGKSRKDDRRVISRCCLSSLQD